MEEAAKGKRDNQSSKAVLPADVVHDIEMLFGVSVTIDQHLVEFNKAIVWLPLEKMPEAHRKIIVAKWDDLNKGFLLASQLIARLKLRTMRAEP